MEMIKKHIRFRGGILDTLVSRRGEHRILELRLGFGVAILVAIGWRILAATQEFGFKSLWEGISAIFVLPGWSFTLAKTHQWFASGMSHAISINIGIYFLAICLIVITRNKFPWSDYKLILSPSLRIDGLLLTILLLLIFPLLFLKPSFVWPDSSDYLASALDISLGRGYSGYRGEPRGPVFPLLVSIPFHFFDANAETGLIVPKLVGTLTFVVLFFFGKSLYGRLAGIIGALLALASYQIRLNLFSSHLLDGLLALFMILSLLLIFLGFEKNKLLFFVFSGVSLGAAVLVKQTGILWVMVPWIAFFLTKEYQTIKNFLGVWFSTSAFLITLYPWMVYVFQSSHKVFPLKPFGDHSLLWIIFNLAFYSFLLIGFWVFWAWKRKPEWLISRFELLKSKAGRLFPIVGLSLLVVSVLGISLSYAKGIFVPSRYRTILPYLKDVIAPVFGDLAWLVLLAWCGSILLAFINRRYRLLAISLVLILPLLIHLSFYGHEARNYFMIVLLSYPVLASFLGVITVWVVKMINELSASERLKSFTIRAGAVFGLIILCAYPVPMITKQVEQNWSITNQDRFAPSSWNVDNRVVHDTAAWIQTHIEEGTPLLFFYVWDGQLRFELKDKYPITTYQFDVLTEYGTGESFIERLSDKTEKYVYIFREQDPTLFTLFWYPESRLYQLIHQSQAKYIVFGDRNASLIGLEDFFDIHPAFTQMHKAEEGEFGTAVYKIQSDLVKPCPDCPTAVQVNAIVELLDLARTKNLDEYKLLKQLGDPISLAIRPTITNRIQWAEAYKRLGEIYEKHGEIDSALIDYYQAFAIDASVGSKHLPTIRTNYSQLLEKYSHEGNERVEIPTWLQKKVPELARDIYQARGELNKAKITYWYTTRGSVPIDDSYTFYNFLDNLSISQNNPSLRPDIFTIGGEVKEVFFQHPPSVYTDTIALPDYPVSLKCDIALSPEVWKYGIGDGVQFELHLLDERGENYSLFSKYIDPGNKPEDQKWHNCEDISLERWEGQTVKIVFATLPNGNINYDWAGWGEPRIVQPVAYNFLTELPSAKLDMGYQEKVRLDWFSIDDDWRPILFQHPAGRVTYRLIVPKQAELKFGLAMDPEVWSPEKGDGVEYNIFIHRLSEPNKLHWLFQHYIDPKNNPEDRHWSDHTVDLTEYSGEIIDIIFETRPGPIGDDRFDWSGWSLPVFLSYTR
jgi:4-amino-4-deoxy-L-arabinose transferase-like glycosyltransferase